MDFSPSYKELKIQDMLFLPFQPFQPLISCRVTPKSTFKKERRFRIEAVPQDFSVNIDLKLHEKHSDCSGPLRWHLPQNTAGLVAVNDKRQIPVSWYLSYIYDVID